MKKTLIFTVAAAAIMGMWISSLHAETAQVSPQDDKVEVIGLCMIEVDAEHWEENVQDILEFIGVTSQSEWNEYDTEWQQSRIPSYNKEEYSSDGKYRYQVIVIPYSDRYAGVMIRVIGAKKVYGDFVAPDSSFETMAGMCIFSVRPDDDHEEWDNEFWDTCHVLGIDAMEREWRMHETEYGPGYSKRGFDEKGENMFTIHLVPPLDEGDLCTVAIVKWTL